MPTYRNNGTDLISSANFTISPNGTKTTDQQYINTDQYPSIVKVSDDPPLKNGFFKILENADPTVGMSKKLSINHSMVLQIKTSNSVSDGATVEVTAFVSITDKPEDFIPIRKFQFVCNKYIDATGTPQFLWYCEKGNRLPPEMIDGWYEMVTFAVTNLTGVLNIDLYVKSY